MITNRASIFLCCLLLGNLGCGDICAMQDPNEFHPNPNALYKRRINFSKADLITVPFELPEQLDIPQPLPQNPHITFAVVNDNGQPVYEHHATPIPESNQLGFNFERKRIWKNPPRIDLGINQQPDVPLRRQSLDDSQLNPNFGNGGFQRRFTTPIFDDFEDDLLVPNNFNFRDNQPNTPSPSKTKRWKYPKPKSDSTHPSYDSERMKEKYGFVAPKKKDTDNMVESEDQFTYFPQPKTTPSKKPVSPSGFKLKRKTSPA